VKNIYLEGQKPLVFKEAEWVEIISRNLCAALKSEPNFWVLLPPFFLYSSFL